MDKVHEQTEEMLVAMEKHISQIYSRANKELEKTAKEYFKSFESEDLKMKKLVESGKLTENKYKQWKKAELMKGKRYKELKQDYAERLLHTNEIATAYINNELPKVYAINYNDIASDVDGIGGYSFSLTDAETVKNLATKDDTLLPYKYVDGKKDVRWNTKKVNAEILQGILQGDSIPKIAKRLENVTEMNRTSAIRNARTTVTSAECKGRIDSYKKAQDDGIILKKEWIATGGDRTRHWHAELDGVQKDVDEPFENAVGKIKYPGDVDADPANVYNCRCSIKAVIKGFKNTKQIGLNDDFTGQNSTNKFNEFLLDKHPEVFGNLEDVEKEIENDYNYKFRSQKFLHKSEPDVYRKVTWEEYEKMSFAQKNSNFPDFESFKKHAIKQQGQEYAEKGSLANGLRRYNLGSIPDGYGNKKGARTEFDKEFKISEFIDKNPDVQFNSESKLYRGVKSTEQGIKDIEKAIQSGDRISMRGLSSWTTDEDIANEFAKHSLRGAKSSQPVIFVEETKGIREAMPFPYSSDSFMPQSEVIYSGNADFIPLKIEKKGKITYVTVKQAKK